MKHNIQIFCFYAACNTQLSGQSPYLTGVSTVVQAQSEQDKENLIPDDPMEWLHRNDNYVPLCVSGHRIVATPHTQGNLLGLSLLLHSTCLLNIKFHVIIACLVLGGSSSRDKLWKNRERYINLCDQKQEELLQLNRDYKRHCKLMTVEPEQTDMPTIT